MVRRFVKWSTAAAAIAMVLAMGAAHRSFSAEETPSERAEAVDINTASVEQLEEIPGLGPALAQRIVEFREKNGPFGSVDELLKVRGIGEKSLEKIRAYLVVGKQKKK